MPGGSRWDRHSTALLCRVILESDPQQVIQRLSLRVSAAILCHGLPPPSSASPHPPQPLSPPPGPRAGDIRLRPLRLPGGQLGAKGLRGHRPARIGIAEEVQTLPCVRGVRRGWEGIGVRVQPLLENSQLRQTRGSWALSRMGAEGMLPTLSHPVGPLRPGQPCSQSCRSPSLLPQVDDNPLCEQSVSQVKSASLASLMRGWVDQLYPAGRRWGAP